MIELRRPALLDPCRHHRERFDSGEAALDEWLRRYAGQNRRRDTAATWVIADADDLVCGIRKRGDDQHRSVGGP